MDISYIISYLIMSASELISDLFQDWMCLFDPSHWFPIAFNTFCVQAISEFALKKKQAFAAMNVSELVPWIITHERVWKNLPEEFKNQTEARE